jgi:transposase
MIYVRQPTESEMAELKRMTQQEIGRVSQRAQMVLLSAQGRTVPEISVIFGRDRKTVRSWIRRFDQYGPTGLYDEPRSGRPRKVNERVADTLEKMVQGDPLHEGSLATFWSVPMLALALAKKLQVKLSNSTMRAVLHGLEFRWGRPRLAMPRKVDPEKAPKQWAIVQAINQAGPEATVLYGDECRIQLLPLLRAMWHRAGQQIRIPTPGTNQSRVLFGALDIRMGEWAHLVRKRMFKEDFIAFLEHLLMVYPHGPILLIVDNFSSHTAHAVKAWLAAHPRLQLLFLPKYSSHLNPVEAIWLRLKNKIAANRLYGSMSILLETVQSFFRQMTPQRAMKWASLMSGRNFLTPT